MTKELGVCRECGIPSGFHEEDCAIYFTAEIDARKRRLLRSLIQAELDKNDEALRAALGGAV